MKKTISILFSAFICLQASAQAVPSLLIPKDARSMSLAGADVAFGMEAEHIFAEAAYTMWAPGTIDTKVVGLDAAVCLGSRFFLTLDGRRFAHRPYDVTTDVGVVKSTFDPSDLAFSLGAGFRFTDALSLCVKGRYVNSLIADKKSGSAIVADASINYGTDSFKAGLAVCNLGGNIDYGTGGWSLPAVAKAGAAYSVAGITATAEADYLLSGGFMAGIGAEYSIKDIAFIRAGYHLGDAQKTVPSYASLGLGVRFVGIQLDAAYLLASDVLGGTLAFALSYSF